MVLKLQHDQLTTMYQQYQTTTPKKLEDAINPRCPRYSNIQDINKTMDHVWMCPCEAALEERQLQWKATLQQIQQCKTPDYMIDKFQSGIQQWQENQGEVEWRQDKWADPPDLIVQMVKEAFEDQTVLG
jgi:hypothetical protein